MLHAGDIEIILDADRHAVEREARAVGGVAVCGLGLGQRVLVAPLDDGVDGAVAFVDTREMGRDQLAPAEVARAEARHHLAGRHAAEVALRHGSSFLD